MNKEKNIGNNICCGIIYFYDSYYKCKCSPKSKIKQNKEI